jgi:integrase
MPTRVARALTRHAQDPHYGGADDLVFPHPSRGGYLSDSTIRDRFQKACIAAGVRRVRFHDLRHTYGTLMAGAGVPLRVLRGLMGHASYSTTEEYAKWAPKSNAQLAFAERAFAATSAPARPA